MITVLESILLAVYVAIALAVSRWLGQQAFGWMPAQATAEAKQVDNLFSFLVSIGTFIFLMIAGIIAVSILFYRAPKNDFSPGHPARGDWRIEATWTIVPIFLVLWVATQSTRIYQQLNIQGLTPIVHLHLEEPAYAEAPKPTDVNNSRPVSEEIDVTAKQWSWSFRYPRRNVTSTELHLPVNQSVRLVLNSEDVLHGFYVPEFRIKQDIIPHRAITFEFQPLREGKYQLHDSQFSGTYFALMGADVYVETSQAYQQWLDRLATQKPTIAANPALAEYNQQRQTPHHQSWATVVPAQPPVVNQP